MSTSENAPGEPCLVLIRTCSHLIPHHLIPPIHMSVLSTHTGQCILLGHWVERDLSWSLPAWNFSSVQFSHSVMSDSFWPHESQHARPPCPSSTSGVYSNSCPSSQWCYPASFCVVPLCSCPQSLPASRSFSMSQLFTWGGQNIGVSASPSVWNLESWK